MPKLAAPSTEKLFLPSTENESEENRGFVVLKTRLLLADVADIQGIESDTEKSYSILEKSITDWNFTDDDGNALPVTSEWIKLLPNQDQVYLIGLIGDLTKKSFAGLSDQENLASPVS